MANLSKISLIDGFEQEPISSDELIKEMQSISKKRATKKKTSNDKLSLAERLKIAEELTYKILGRYKGFVRVIRDEQELHDYISKAIECDYLSLDTETNNSLDPLTCKMAGLCLYVPNTRPVYVPVSHVIPGTDELLANQISLSFIADEFKRLKEHNTKIVYHNAVFDIRVCYNTAGVYLPIWWDTMIASQLLDENVQAKLKYQFRLRVDSTVDTYNIETIYSGVRYVDVDPEVFALYAAIDAYDTYLLQQYQQKIFEQEDMKRLYNLFLNIEAPVSLVVAHMEDDGIAVDLDFVKRLNDKYERHLKENLDKLCKMCLPYSSQIKKYQETKKLDNPINFDSDKQLKIVLYDIMKVQPIDEKKSTEKDVLKALNTDFTNTILTYRHYSKLISAFTSKLPEWVSEKDGKVHAHFNQLGTEEKNVKTGRFSSTNPNLQQMPSKEKSMRLAFIADTKYEDISVEQNKFIVKDYTDVETENGWKIAKEIVVGDIILATEEEKEKQLIVIKTEKEENNIVIYVEER